MPYFRRRRFYRRRAGVRSTYGRRIRPYRRFRNLRRRRGHLRTTRIKVRSPLSADKAYVKLKWNYAQSVSSLTGNAYELKIRANSIFDPQYATGGTPVQGYTQWNAFYERYQVTGCKIRVDYYSPVSEVGPPMLVAVVPSQEVTGAPGVAPSYGAWSSTDIQYIRLARSKIATYHSGIGKVTVKNYMTTQKIFGRKLTEMDNTISDFDADPVQQWYWHVLVKALVGTDVAHGYVNVRVTYYANLSKRDLDIVPA